MARRPGKEYKSHDAPRERSASLPPGPGGLRCGVGGNYGAPSGAQLSVRGAYRGIEGKGTLILMDTVAGLRDADRRQYREQLFAQLRHDSCSR